MKYIFFSCIFAFCASAFSQCRSQEPLGKGEIDWFMSTKIVTFNIEKLVSDEIVRTTGFAEYDHVKEINVFFKAKRTSDSICRQNVLTFYKDTSRDINSDWKLIPETKNLISIASNNEACNSLSNFENSISVHNVTDTEILAIYNSFSKIKLSGIFSKNFFTSLPRLISLKKENISSIYRENETKVTLNFKSNSWCGNFTSITLLKDQGEFKVKSVNLVII